MLTTATQPTPAELELAKKLVEWLESEVPSLLIPAPANVAAFLAAHRAPTIHLRYGVFVTGQTVETPIATFEYADQARSWAKSQYYNFEVRELTTDPAQAHAAEMDVALRHIQEMAAEDIRMGDSGGAIWQIEANARALLTTLERERQTQKGKTE